MIIVLGGMPGSGKSTVAKQLAKKLGWPHYYMGGLRREAAKKRGLTLEEYNKLGETDPTTDKEVDELQKKLGETQDNFVIEGRTSFYFIPRALKIFVDVEEMEGAKRIWQDLRQNAERNEGKTAKSVEDVLQLNQERIASDKKRYQQYYGFDAYDKSHYDYVIDSTNLSAEEKFAKIYKIVRKELNKP
ncbi:MAG: cytidylate kinase family protein [Patescibacteria group bacterium]|nr:cytidylate kinase family protein [Patescibacteria group bacterium]MDD5490995.1 cytidylate kinase family protein [Patescibacteria group bacterium]